jgi:hypothetical protein
MLGMLSFPVRDQRLFLNSTAPLFAVGLQRMEGGGQLQHETKTRRRLLIVDKQLGVSHFLRFSRSGLPNGRHHSVLVTLPEVGSSLQHLSIVHSSATGPAQRVGRLAATAPKGLSDRFSGFNVWAEGNRIEKFCYMESDEAPHGTHDGGSHFSKTARSGAPRFIL